MSQIHPVDSTTLFGIPRNTSVLPVLRYSISHAPT